jgi:putative endonuclease
MTVSKSRVNLGRRGEELAAEELYRQGYSVVSRNWRCRWGEVDLVAQRDVAWTFFEVRTRRGRSFGTPEESITEAKLERMIDVAQMYLAEHDINAHDVDWRLGIVAVEMDRTGRLMRIDVYENVY